MHDDTQNFNGVLVFADQLFRCNERYKDELCVSFLICPRASCNKACIFPNSADFKDRIFELPRCFCSLHEVAGKYINF